MFSISKEIHFCYGHRLLKHQGKCRHLHGHNAKAVIDIEAEELDELGMVVDFSDIGRFVESWINDHIDHTMLMHKDDPFLPALQEAGERVTVMEQNPTAENIACLIYEYVKNNNFAVKKVTLWESNGASASYSES